MAINIFDMFGNLVYFDNTLVLDISDIFKILGVQYVQLCTNFVLFSFMEYIIV